MTYSYTTPLTETLLYGFSMTTYRHPAKAVWIVALNDPLGNSVEVLQTVREDCIRRNQARIREKAERWYPEESMTGRDLQKQVDRLGGWYS